MPAIMALERELFPDDAWTPEMFASEFAQSASRRLYLVAEEGDAVIGYAGMMFTGGPQADVLTLAVDPAHWGRGAGTALLCALIDAAARRGHAEVVLEVRKNNPRARPAGRPATMSHSVRASGYAGPIAGPNASGYSSAPAPATGRCAAPSIELAGPTAGPSKRRPAASYRAQ